MAGRISGRWRCVAEHRDGSQDYFGWDLTLDWQTNRVVGRFDPDTDYRFAYISGGSFDSNRLVLKVEYIQNRYEVRGTLEGTFMKGTWRKSDGSEQGTWTADREERHQVDLPKTPSVPLLAWRRKRSGEVTYTGGERPAGEGWEPMGPPLGRVWRIPPGGEAKSARAERVK